MVGFRIALATLLLASTAEAFVSRDTGRLSHQTTRRRTVSAGRVRVNVANTLPPPSEDDQQAAGLRAVLSNVTTSAFESMSMEGDVDEAALRKKRLQLAARSQKASSGTFRVQLDMAEEVGLSLAQVEAGRKMSVVELDMDAMKLEAVALGELEGIQRQRMDWPTMVGRLDTDFRGLLVSSVIQGSRAWEAGIRAGDIMTAMSATIGESVWPTSTLEGVQSAWRSRKAMSRQAVLEFSRLAETVDNVYELTLEKPLGLEVKETTDGMVEVTGFTENAPNLVRHAVKVGDRITAVDSSWGDQMWPVSTIEGLVSACTSRFPKNTVTLRLERPVENLALTLDVAEPTTRTTTASSVRSTSVATQDGPATKKELLKRCRDVLQRYRSDSDSRAQISGFKGKYDVPAIVADKVVDTLASERVSVDSVTLSMIMEAYLSCNQPESALRVFEGAVGLRADGSPLPLTESLIGRNGGGFLPNESALNLFTATGVMQAHAQRGDFLAVSRVLAALEGRSGVLVGGLESAPWPFTGAYGSIKPDTQCYNVAIAAAEKVGGEEALEMGLALFATMVDPDQMTTAADRSPNHDVVTYNTMISALCNARRFDEAFGLFDRMKQSGIRPDKYTYTPLIKACTTDGDIDELLYDMQERGVKGDVITYNMMIKTLCGDRKLSDATRMVTEMESRGISPDSMTYGLLMNAMLKADKATACLTLFESACANAKTAHLTDNVYLYTTAITAASVLRNYERALELVTRMSAKGVKPNVQTLTAVVGACLSAHKPDLAVKIFQKIESPDGYAVSQGLRALSENGQYAEALSMLKQQRKGQRVLSGKEMMLAYKRILTASLEDQDFDVAMDTLTELLKRGYIPNKAMLAAMLAALHLKNPRERIALVSSTNTEPTFEFLLFTMDALSARNLPIESSLYVPFLSLGSLLGGRAKRIVSYMANSRASTVSAGTSILSAADDNSEDNASAWPGWRSIYQNYDLYKSELPHPKAPRIQVRVPPKEVSFVLRAEKNLVAAKSRKRKLTTSTTQ
jgi:pentatricopeptide repeat protein